MNYPCIIVERPHQRPAEAWAAHSAEDVINVAADSWEKSDCTTPEPMDEAAALEWLGHDLCVVIVLETAAECERYILDDTYYTFHGRHNKAIGEVIREAIVLGWMAKESEETEDMPWPECLRARFAAGAKLY